MTTLESQSTNVSQNKKRKMNKVNSLSTNKGETSL